MWSRSAERAVRVALVLAGALAGASPIASGFAVAHARAEDPAPAAGGALRLAADPPRPVLAGDVTVDLRVSAPAEVEDLSLTASAGRIDGVRRLPGGGFAARYRPPTERVPQVVIVAAVAHTGRGLEDGWLAIPMSGRGTARVRGAPGTAVSVRIGDRTFGPQTAGDDGFAAIPVVVPPGIREGHQGFRPVDLRVPETSLVHAVADRAAVHADREERVRVLAYVVAPHGAARRGDTPLFEPSRGSVTFTEREPGAWVGSWTLPAGPAGEERLVVRLASARAKRAVVRVSALAGPAAVVAVSVDRAGLVAGGEGATVVARTLDAAGNPVPATLALDATGARLDAVEERRPGVVQARLSAGTALHGDEAVVTATAPAVGIAGARIVPLRAGDPAAIRFARAPVARGDGASETVLRVLVADRFGNPVAAAPEVTAERGRIAGVAAAGRGAYDVRYVAPAVDRPAADALVARAGAARATLAPAIAPPAPPFRADAIAGVLGDLRGRFAGSTALVAVERPQLLAAALRAGVDPALRLEAGVLSAAGARGVLLAGPSLRLGGGPVRLAVTATGGALVGAGRAAPAARAALSLSLSRAGAEPFLELSALGAGRGAPGSFLAAGVAVGVRLGLGRTP